MNNYIDKCPGPCVICSGFHSRHFFQSSFSNHAYSPNINKVSCKTKNVVYLITCDQCNMKYVGETSQEFRKRMYQHRSMIRRCKDSSPILYQHFKNGTCSSYSFQIIEKIDDVANADEVRRDRENFWISTLKTKQPYGLNIKFACPSNIVHNHFSVHNKVRGPKKRRCNKASPSWNDTLSSFTNSYDEIKLVYNLCHSINLKLVRKYIRHIEDTDRLYKYLPLIKDIVNYRIHLAQISKNKIKRTNHPTILFNYVNRYMDDINFPRLFKNKLIKSIWPKTVDIKFSKPKVRFTYDKPLCLSLCNYRNFACDNTTFIGNCRCARSTFMDNHHRHIVTGDLSIIRNRELRKLFEEGSKFRPPKAANKFIARSSVSEGIHNYIHKVCNKLKLPYRTFADWRISIMLHFNDLIANWENSSTDYTFTEDMIKELAYLKRNFIITTIDKANQNYAIICKKFYHDTIIGELSNINGSYSKVDIDIELLKLRQHNQSYKLFDCVRPNLEIQSLPYIQFIPKMHKKPTGARFIISSSKAITKSISQAIGHCLKLLLNSRAKYCKTIYDNTGVNTFWIIDNNNNILRDIFHVNNLKMAKSIYTLDFTTLYTKLDHKDLLKTLTIFINNTLKDRCLIYKGKYTHFSNDPDNYPNNVITTHRLINMLSWLVNNSYFNYRGSIFKQNIGIPMGTDCAPFLANIYLHQYEFNYMTKLMKSNIQLARSLNLTYRYIDDITILNDNGYFVKSYIDIYPDSLELKLVNESPNKADILDISVNILDNIFITKLYDKRDGYSFTPIKFPSANSNISLNIIHNIIINQITRLFKLTSKGLDFRYSCYGLFTTCLARNYKPRTILPIFNKALLSLPISGRSDIKVDEIIEDFQFFF